MELKIENFKKDIVNSVNQSELPLVIVSYVFRDLLAEIDNMRSQELARAKQAEQESQEQPEDLDTI